MTNVEQNLMGDDWPFELFPEEWNRKGELVNQESKKTDKQELESLPDPFHTPAE